MEIAKLVLEYTKILIWPVIILFVLYLFGGAIRTRIEQLKTVSATGAGITAAFEGTGIEQRTGEIETKIKSLTGLVPHMWLNLREIKVSQHDCLNMAEKALRQSGFSRIGRDNDISIYGDFIEDGKGYSGVVWCVQELRLVFFAVSGQRSDTAQRKVTEVITDLEKEHP